MAMMFTVTVKMGASGTMGIIVPMLLTMKRRKWSIGIRIDFGVGVGEGLAAVCGHQSGGARDAGCEARVLPGRSKWRWRNAPLPGTFSVLLSASISAPAHVRCARGNRPAGGFGAYRGRDPTRRRLWGANIQLDRCY